MFARKMLLTTIFMGVLAAHLRAGSIGYQETSLGGNSYTYTYFLSGFNLSVNQALDIQFGASQYGVLSNGVVGSGFSLMLLQPNNPQGAFGDYLAEAIVNNPSLTGTFSVNFTFLGQGLPGAQAFVVDQFDQNNNFVSVIGSGTTALQQGSGGTGGSGSGTQTDTPEPSAFLLAGLGLLAVSIGGRLRRRSFAGRI
jgi:hypothetical protein